MNEAITLPLPLLPVWNTEEPLDPARHGTLEILYSEGDALHLWGRGNTLEIDAARDAIRGLQEAGYSAFVETPTGPEGPVADFDPQALGYVLVPAIRGGAP